MHVRLRERGHLSDQRLSSGVLGVAEAGSDYFASDKIAAFSILNPTGENIRAAHEGSEERSMESCKVAAVRAAAAAAAVLVPAGRIAPVQSDPQG